MAPLSDSLTITRVVAASQRIHASLDVGRAEAIAVTLDELRDLADARCAILTHLDEVDGIAVERVAARSWDGVGGPILNVDDTWPWSVGPTCALLAGETLRYEPDFPGHFSASPFLRVCAITGIVTLPITAPEDDRIVAAIVIVDPRPLDDDDCEVLRLLGTVGGAVVVADLAHRAAEAHRARVDLELLGTLDEVRDAQDQVGNSIAVVLGWLRLLANSSNAANAESGPPGGIQIAIRRLEEAQASISELLRRTASTALRDHADDPVNASAVSRAVGRTSSEPPDIWVRANARHLATFLADAAETLSPRELITQDAWIVPFARDGLVTTSSLSALHASGGAIVSVDGTQAAQWRRTAAPITT